MTSRTLINFSSPAEYRRWNAASRPELSGVDELVCSICREAIEETSSLLAHQVERGKGYWHPQHPACLITWSGDISHGASCPECRTELNSFISFPDGEVDGFIGSPRALTYNLRWLSAVGGLAVGSTVGKWMGSGFSAAVAGTALLSPSLGISRAISAGCAIHAGITAARFLKDYRGGSEALELPVPRITRYGGLLHTGVYLSVIAAAMLSQASPEGRTARVWRGVSVLAAGPLLYAAERAGIRVGEEVGQAFLRGGLDTAYTLVVPHNQTLKMILSARGSVS